MDRKQIYIPLCFGNNSVSRPMESMSQFARKIRTEKQVCQQALSSVCSVVLSKYLVETTGETLFILVKS